MNPAPCIAIEQLTVPSLSPAEIRLGVNKVRTRAQIRKGLLRVWRPGEKEYFLWIPNTIETVNPRLPVNGARWWQPPASG